MLCAGPRDVVRSYGRGLVFPMRGAGAGMSESRPTVGEVAAHLRAHPEQCVEVFEALDDLYNNRDTLRGCWCDGCDCYYYSKRKCKNLPSSKAVSK